MTIKHGKIKDLSENYKGWFMGHFMEKNTPFNTSDFEIKWGIHKAGERNESVALNKTSKSLAILISGKFTLTFGSKKVILKNKGDYCYWDTGVAHDWIVNEDCVVLTIRWPSVPKDQKSI